MSIDYERLREWLDEATPGPWEASSGVAGVPEGWDEHWIMIRIGYDNFPLRSLDPIGEEDYANFNLTALAPDMARELLRLRDRVEQVAGLLKRTEIAKDTAGDHAQANAYMYAHQHVTALLDGEHHDI